MMNYLAIVRKELQCLFVSPIAYVVLAVFFTVSGYFFFLILSVIVEQSVMRAQFAPGPMDIPTQVMQNFLGVLSTILLFLLPMITMGIFAEEKKRGTIELLFTSPLTNLQLILGKFTAGLAFILVMMLLPAFNTLWLYWYSEPTPALTPFFNGILGALLMGGALLAVGMFVSSLTENQIVAAAVTFGLFLVLWVIDASAGSGTTFVNETLRYLSVLNHYQDFTRGIFDTQHVVFYLSFIMLGLFMTSLSLDSAKWRK